MSLEVRPLQILLVEDNPADAELTCISLKSAKVANEVRVAETVDEALTVLGEPSSRPDLILLDLNLPGRPGTDLLQTVKGDPATAHIPVVVLTSSKAQSDIARSYELKANAYVSKPVRLDEFSEIMRAIDDFWLVAVRLPGSGGDV